MNRHQNSDWASFWDALHTSALPLYLSLTLVAVIGAVDMWLAGVSGGCAQAAVGIADQVLFLTVLLATGLSGGVASCVARAHGANDRELVRLYAKDAMIASVILGLISMTLSLVFCQPVIQFLSSSNSTTDLAIDYLRICSIANIPWCLAVVQSSILRAIGEARQCVIVWLVITGVSVGLALAAYGLWHGDSIAWLQLIATTWVLGAVAGAVVGFVCVQKTIFAIAQSRKVDTNSDTTYREGTLNRILKFASIGIPISFTEAGWILANFLTYKILAQLPSGADAQAAWTIRMKLDELIFLTPILAMSMTAATLAGQYLGAGNRRQARTVTVQIAISSCLISLVISLCMASISNRIAGCFSSELAIVDLTAQMIGAAPWLVPAMTLYLVLFGAMEGAGFTRMPMIAIVVGLFVVRLPVSWLFGVTFDGEISGIVSALLVSNLVMAAWAWSLFQSNRWEITGC